MEKEFGSWFPYQQYGLQSSFSNFSDRLVPGRRNYVPAFMSRYMKEVSINGTFPMVPGSGLPLSKASQPIEPCNRFNCMPRFMQAFVPPLASSLKEKPALREDNCGVNGGPSVVSDGMEKKFLVFDRCGDQTTLIYNSGVEAHSGRLPSWNRKQPVTGDVIEEKLLLKENSNPRFSPFCNLELDQESLGDGLDNEMHEDTEELNALLDSDDENDYLENDEVTSTGHSPGTLADHDIQHLCVAEDVASSAGSTKRRKLSDGAYNVPSLVHAMVPEKPVKSHELEDDAESCCGNFENQVSEQSFSLSGKKRSRKDDIRKTLSVLQNLIPGAKGKNALVVIDEAVSYLQFLKDKAQSLDLDAV